MISDRLHARCSTDAPVTTMHGASGEVLICINVKVQQGRMLAKGNRGDAVVLGPHGEVSFGD